MAIFLMKVYADKNLNMKEIYILKMINNKLLMLM